MVSLPNSACVVVPAYRPQLAADEEVALRQCLRVLGARPVIIAAPQGLDLRCCEELARSEGRQLKVEWFEPEFFASVATYNRLMLSRRFYRRFRDYEYLLVHQLDAFVFRDELDIWTGRGLDYVGGPWFEQYSGSGASSGMLPRGGGGGFSLRRVRSFLRVLETWRIMKGPGALLREYRDAGKPLGPGTLLKVAAKSFGYKNNSRYLIRATTRLNEDLFWTDFAPLIYPGFRVADAKTAIGFSFECQPRRQYEANGGRLPFGCHAWARYDRDFWRPFFKEQGFDV